MYFSESMLESVKGAYKKMRTLSIVLSIAMVILGFIMFFVPVTGAMIVMWLMVAGLLFKSLMDIIVYASLPKGAKDGWSLASAIIWFLLALSLICDGLFGDVVENIFIFASFQTVFAVMIGFVAIFNGIISLCACREVKAMGVSPVGCILSGILGIIAGISILSFPLAAMIGLTVFYGLFLLISGIALLCRTLSY